MVVVAVSVFACRGGRPAQVGTHAALVESSQASAPQGTSRADWDSANVSGFYYLQDPTPPWAADIEFFQVSSTDLAPLAGDTSSAGARVLHPSSADSEALAAHPDILQFQATPLWGFVHLKTSPDIMPINFEMVKSRVAAGTLTFSTEAVSGVSYDFEGTFLEVPENARYGDTVLVGHLRKLREGRVIGEGQVKLTYSRGE